MDRALAFRLASALADAEFSCSVSIGVHPKHIPHESCSVSVHAMRLTADELARLAEIGDEHGCDMHFISGDGMTFFDKPTSSRRP